VDEFGYRVRSGAVISEIIDGEAVIMDMHSGNYFSTDGVGAVLWAMADAGFTQQAILAAAQAAYPLSPECRDEAAAFLAGIEASGLVVRTPGGGGGEVPAFAGAYATPILASHADMQDLIQLDPIHDVDAIGWPARKEQA
jgi:hypothetical protein